MKQILLLFLTVITWSSFAMADGNEPRSAILLQGLEWMEASCSAELSPRANELMNAYKDAVINGPQKKVLETFSAYVKEVGQSIWALQMLPEILIRDGQYDDAMRAVVYGESQPRNGFHPVYWLQYKVRILQAQGKLEEALTAVREYQASPLHKPHRLAAQFEGALLIEMGREAEAVVSLRVSSSRWVKDELLAEMLQSVQTTDRRIEYLHSEIRQLTRDGRFKEASAKLQELEELTGPDETYSLILKLDVLAGLRDDIGVLRTGNHILSKEKNNVIVRMRKGIALMNLNQQRYARTEFDLALDIEPDNVPILYLRARTSRKLKEYQAALNDLDRVLTLKGGRDLPAVDLALEILAVTGQGGKAQSWVKRVPTDLQTPVLKAKGQVLSGDFATAIRTLSGLKEDTPLIRWFTAWAQYGLGDYHASYETLLSILSMPTNGRKNNFWPVAALLHLEKLMPGHPRPPEFERELLAFPEGRREALMAISQSYRWAKLSLD